MPAMIVHDAVTGRPSRAVTSRAIAVSSGERRTGCRLV
jgi:hypothetical protein